jgi:hypothetical protein
MRIGIKVWMTVVVAAGSLVAGAGVASAAPAGVAPRFAAQARAAHISVAKAGQLQQEVTSYIHEHGGTQAALNVVDVPGGSITFAVPGEKYARDLATTPKVLAAATACPIGSFCAYEGEFYGGNERSYFSNCEENTMPWSSEGSYKNELPDGEWANWFNASQELIYETPPAASENPEVSWIPVAYIEAWSGNCT